MPHQRLNRAALLRGGLGALAFVALGAPKMTFAAEAGYEVHYSPEEWRKRLGPQRFNILREAGTEAPFSSKLDYEHRRGTYACAGCNLPLFASQTKFESGTGWPSFYDHLPNAVRTKDDYALIEHRTEVLCRRCGGHLGHVFDDGPKPTGLRYCMNGLAMLFHPR